MSKLIDAAREFWKQCPQLSFVDAMAAFAEQQIALAVAEAVKAERERLENAVQKVIDVHRQMTSPKGVTGNIVHACEMCEALNDLTALFAKEIGGTDVTDR